MRARYLILLATLVAGLLVAAVPSQGPRFNGLRGPAPLDTEPKAPRMAREENFDVRRGRAYTSQPPTIPHSIEKYEITRNVNMCMYCHARVRNNEFGAPMVSATHYMNRDFDFLAEISPRRYFCTQCHVPQTDAVPPVANTFMDVEDIIERERAATQQGKKGPEKNDKAAQ